MIIGYLIIEGVGIGLTFQTTLVAAQATSAKKDRAVVTGARNFFRTIGGAFGLASMNSSISADLTVSLRSHFEQCSRRETGWRSLILSRIARGSD